MKGVIARAWGYCPLCEEWVPEGQLIRIEKGFRVRGYRYFRMCVSCAQALRRRRQEKIDGGG